MGLQIKYFNFLFFTGFRRILLQKKSYISMNVTVMLKTCWTGLHSTMEHLTALQFDLDSSGRNIQEIQNIEG